VRKNKTKTTDQHEVSPTSQTGLKTHRRNTSKQNEQGLKPIGILNKAFIIIAEQMDSSIYSTLATLLGETKSANHDGRSSARIDEDQYHRRTI
jgi:hypothetical protein